MMRRRALLFALTFTAAALYGQYKTIDNFELSNPAPAYAISMETGSTLTLTADSTDKIEGKYSLVTYSVCPSKHSYVKVRNDSPSKSKNNPHPN